jgi:iron complex transport system ATP-binding protein
VTVINAHRVSIRAGSATLIEHVDLDVGAGEVVAIVGPNGAGKSTLLAALAGDRRLTSGRVNLHGRDVSSISIPDLATLRAVLPQHSQLSLAFTALEVVQLGGRTIDASAARRCLAAVELEAFAERTYPSLSGGEQQRVQLARVMAQLAISSQAALLLDEPTSALDPRHQQVVLASARSAASRGHAVVVVLHDLTLAARWCDRVVLLARGRVIGDGPPEKILTPARLETAYGVTFEILHGERGLVIASV